MDPNVASLLLRQHKALMDEGVGPKPGRGFDDLEILRRAAHWSEDPRLSLHEGWDLNIVTDDDHAGGCDCRDARIHRGAQPTCDECRRPLFDDGSHFCRPGGH